MASDKIEAGDIKGITKGENLFEGQRVKACSVHMTRADLYFTCIVAASMKKKVSSVQFSKFMSYKPTFTTHFSIYNIKSYLSQL